MPTGLVGGPSPAAWGWPPATAWSYWPSGPVLPPRPRLPIVATILAVGAGLTFSLPWATFSYSLSSAYDLGSFSYSVSLITMLDDGDWIAHLWPDLVVFGFLLAIASSFLDAVFRLGRQAAIAEVLGFGSISAGVVVALASRFADWPGSLDTFNSVSAGLGAWLCLLLAAAGAAVALVRFVSPRAFTPATAAAVARPAAGPFPPGYPTQYAPQYPPSYPPPYGAPYPTPYAPQYPPTWASQSPLPPPPRPPRRAPRGKPSLRPRPWTCRAPRERWSLSKPDGQRHVRSVPVSGLSSAETPRRASSWPTRWSVHITPPSNAAGRAGWFGAWTSPTQPGCSTPPAGPTRSRANWVSGPESC